jgi:hypothetical protein
MFSERRDQVRTVSESGNGSFRRPASWLDHARCSENSAGFVVCDQRLRAPEVVGIERPRADLSIDRTNCAANDLPELDFVQSGGLADALAPAA